MAAFFKRRAKPGPSKNEQKVQRGLQAEARARGGSSVQQKFPTVEHLALLIDIITPQAQAIDHQTRSFSASEPCDFAVPCPGRCGQGSYDLSYKVKSAVEARESLSEGSLICKEPLFAGSSDSCGYTLKYRVEIRYLPKPD